MILLLTACTQKLSPIEIEAIKYEKVLAWVENVDATGIADKDIKNNRIKFYQVCSYSCSTVGVGSINADRCFPSIMSVPLEGTSDVILSERHKHLMDIAYAFAKQYNSIVAEHLEAQGASECKEGVDWGLALNSITDLVWSLENDISKQGSVGLSVENGPNKSDFMVVLPYEFTTQLGTRLCESLAESLPNEKVSLEISTRQDVENSKVIWCKNGAQVNRS